MTIALGILAKGGVVIAADTQESLGDTKLEARKIYTRLIPKEDRGFSGTGAGSAVYLDALHQRMAKEFRQEKRPDVLEERFPSALEDFYARHVRGARTFGVADKDSRIEMPCTILGVTWPRRDPWLISTEDNVLRFCKDPVAVGIGADYATMLLGRLIPSKVDIPVELAAYIAAYVIYRVKNYKEGCGKGTHVTLLENGRGRYFAESAIDLLESTFGRYVQFESIVASYMLGRETADESTMLLHELDALRTRIHDLPSSIKAMNMLNFHWKDSQRTPSSGNVFEAIGGRAEWEPFKPSSRRRRRAKTRGR